MAGSTTRSRINEIESDLAHLTEDELNTICCGEESEQERLASKQVLDFLCRIFDEEYLVKEQSHDEV